MEVTIHPNDFSNFLRCLSLLKDNCIDVDIQGGFLRQKTDNRANVFEMDLGPLIRDLDITISYVERKLPLLKSLSGQEVKVTITENNISFLGERFKYEFRLPTALENEFMTSEELCSIFSLREEDVVLEHTINKEISRLMKAISRQFHIVSFQILFEEDTASIIATSKDKSKSEYARIAHRIPIRVPWKGFSNIVVTPFIIDCDGDIFFKMYRVHEDMCVNKFRASIGKITAIIYCRSQLLEETSAETS